MNRHVSQTHSECLDVIEMFTSIQGESTWAGRLCGFVRLAGCNLRCRWCDTLYSHGTGKRCTVSEILDQVDAWQIPLVEITGGEPLLQAGTPPLAKALIDKGYTVLVETNGSMPINLLPDEVIRIMDIKCPDSGMSGNMDWKNIKKIKGHDEIKFVLASRADYVWAQQIIHEYTLFEACNCVLFSPVSEKLPPEILAQWMIEDRSRATMQLQLHKSIWPAHTRGV
ncbi:MAG: radical SAM protein [Candidatus Hydrogenedentes bacterium]|jgi:7-carboxy-7-deazaguanine synthase|nr:radical SAM protein [Candidatus Hydrogenedentota bacterium]